MKFEKWQALGNDYVIIEAADLPWEPTQARSRESAIPISGSEPTGCC